MTTGKKLSFQIWMLKGESYVEEGPSALGGRRLSEICPTHPSPSPISMCLSWETKNRLDMPQGA